MDTKRRIITVRFRFCKSFPSFSVVRRPSDVHLREVLLRGGLLDEEVDLPGHRERDVHLAALLCPGAPALLGGHQAVQAGLDGSQGLGSLLVAAVTLALCVLKR